MADMADYDIEQGIDELARHEKGECDGPCTYCKSARKYAILQEQLNKKRSKRRGK